MSTTGQQKVILITGASSGIGEFTAKELIKQGHIVYGAARRIDKMKSLEQMGGRALKVDIVKENELRNAVDTIMNERHRIDVLWNNAGFGLYGSIEEIGIDEAKCQFDVNLFGLARLTQLVIPIMRKQKSGTIINTSSMAGRMYTPLGAWYHSTKYALEGFTDCLRLELKQFGIKVVLIEPGAIESEFTNVMIPPLLKRSQGGPYENMAKAIQEASEGIYKKGGASKPKVISDTILKIINQKDPKTRYLVGKFAKPLVFIREKFGDKIFDKVIMGKVEKLRK